MRFIFLDVDGVLNSCPQINRDFSENDSNQSYFLSDYYISNLKRLHDKFPNTWIVLTSNFWNRSNQRKQLDEKLKEFGLKIFAEAPHHFIENGEICTTRAQEIREFLRMYSGVESWVSLDDDYSAEQYDDIGKNFSKHLCKTEFGSNDDLVTECGLNQIKMHVAMEILGGLLD